MNNKRIVITGIGPISSVGIGKESFWHGVLEKKVNLKKEKCLINDELLGEFYAHKVDGFDIHNFGIDNEKLDDIKIWKEGEEIADLNYLIACIKLALDDSKIDFNKDDNGIGLVLAHENLGLMPFGYKVSDLAYEMLIDKKKSEFSKRVFFTSFYHKFLTSGYDVQTFADLFHIARCFNIHNYSLFINNACASGLYAYEAASQIIKSEQARAVVVASSDYPDIYKYVWFKELGIYSPDGIIRPFCKDSNGLVFGDGGVGIVLEDYAHAKKRKATIYAEYAGGGFDLEGWKITVPQIGSRSYHRAILTALKRAKTSAKNIDLLVPHGVGSAPIDYYESKAIADIFGSNSDKPWITTFKPYIGHCLGASALIESVILLLALKNNVIPPTLNCDNIDPRFNISLVKEKKQAVLKTAIKITCAFAGFNSASVFKKI